MRRVVWNLGLPRTGTTTVAAELKTLGLECQTIVPGWIGKGPAIEHHDINPPEGTLLIATTRPLETWLPSFQAWRPAWSETEVQELFFQHHRMLTDWMTKREVGLLRVTEGWSGLFHALAVAAHRERLQVLNQRAA